MSVLIPNERGLDAALALGSPARAPGLRRGQRLPVGVRDPQPQERQPLDRRVAGRAGGGARPRARGGAALRGRDLDFLRLPVRGRRAARAGARDRRRACATRAPRRSASATRPGWPTRCRCASSSRARARRSGTEVELTAHFHNTRGQGLANVLAALEAGVDELRVELRRARRLPGAGRARPATSRPRISSRCSHEMGIETGIDLQALLACARRVQEILGRPLGSHTLVAGPVEWRR